MSPKSRRRLLLLAILLGAFVVRLGGINDRGFPFSFYEDENANLKRAVVFYKPSGLDLNPGWFNKPAFGYYLNFGEFGFYYLYGRYLGGEFESSTDFASHFVNDRAPFLLIARFFNCLSAVLTIWVLYALGSRLFGRRVGLLASFILAILPGHVIWSQMVKHDVLATLLATLSMACLVKAADTDRWRDWILAGVFAGLGTATKYTPLVMAAPIVGLWAFGRTGAATSEFSRWRMGRLGRVVASGFALLAAFFIGSPYNFLDGRWLSERIRPQLDHVQTLFFGAGEVDPSQDSWFGLLARLWHTIDDARCLGLLLIALTLVGAVAGLRGRSRQGSGLILTFMAFSIFAITAANEQYPRENHLVILYPFCALFAARGLAVLIGRLPKLIGEKSLVWGIAAILLLLPLPGFPGQGLRLEWQELQRPVTKLCAFNWVQENIPEGETIIIDQSIIPVGFSDGRAAWMQGRIQRELEKAARILAEHEARPPSKERDQTLEYWRRRQADYRKYELEWSLNAAAATSYPFKRYDAIILQHVWQTDIKEEIESKTYGYNDLWGWKPTQIPAGVAPVERYRVVRDALPESIGPEALARFPVLESPAAFLISAKKSYHNYLREHRVLAFPEYAAFYRDLKAHYHCWEIPEVYTEQGLDTVRIWDLRERVDAPEVRRLDPQAWKGAPRAR